MRKNVFLKTLLSFFVALSTISTSVVPAIAEEAGAEEEVVAETDDSEEETDVEDETEPGEEEVEVEIEPEEEEEGADGTGSLEFDASADEVAVTAAASSGAFPEGTEMTAETVTDTDVLDLIKNAVGDNAEILAAVDITFTNEGEAVQPDEAVRVAFAANGITYSENLKVVHVDDKGEELTATVLDQELIETEDGGVAFDADSFSVYAVVDDSEDENARVTVNFISGSETIATVYVKNSDTAEEITKIVYDPGVGTVPASSLFKGWRIDHETATDNPYTIDGVRTFLLNHSITEGTTLNIYAVFHRIATVTYVDTELVTLGTDNVELEGDDETGYSGTYTINKNYTPTDTTHNFEGWDVFAGTVNSAVVYEGDPPVAKPVEAPYAINTEITISNDITLMVNCPEGYWLVFEEGLKGATYNAPKFVKDGKTPKDLGVPDNLLEMVCVGYTFDDWYDGPGDDAQKFKFENALSGNTTAYAHWTQNSSATYTVVVWKERMSDTYAGVSAAGAEREYDFSESFTFTGQTDATVSNVLRSTTSYVTDGDTANTRYYNAVINGTTLNQTYKKDDTYPYVGYHCASIDENVKIKADGTSVVNVYYDRNTVKYTFYTVEYTRVTNNNGTQYGITNGQYVDLVRYGAGAWYAYNPTTSTSSNYDYYGYVNGEYVSIDTTTYQGQTVWYYTRNNTNYIYTGTRYRLQSYSGNRYTAAWTNVYAEETGLYGETLNWPEDQSYWWYEEYTGNKGSGTRMTYKSAFLPLDANMKISYYGTQHEGSGTISFYIQNVNGGTTDNDYTSAYTVAVSGGNFSINDKFTGFTAYKYRVDGGEWQDVGTLDPSSGIYGESVSYESTLDIRYNRISGVITFRDGKYVNGNDIDQEESVQAEALHTSDPYYYEADVSSYNKDKTNYYEPESPISGYTFGGWYADDTCTHTYTFTTMPANGITVYAKWIKNQYRVFLHPNVEQDDTSLDWGTQQQMNFRVSIGDKISIPTGIRDDYEMIGWYTDEALTNAFAPATIMNETTVKTEYHKNTDMTDSTAAPVIPSDPTDPTYEAKVAEYAEYYQTYGRYGILPAEQYNADTERAWITKKYDLYAKWSAKFLGAAGIKLHYDVGEGTGGPQDDNVLYKDNVEAVTDAAAVAPEGKQFSHWILQRWDNNAEDYVDTNIKLNPGDTFTVLKSYARQTANSDNTPENPSYTYTIQLKAEYVDRDAPTPTHIDWYSNVKAMGMTGDDSLDLAKMAVNITQTDATAGATAVDGIVSGKGKKIEYLSDMQINQAISILDATTFSYPNYRFAGWAKTPDIETEEDLFLKYTDTGYQAKVNKRDGEGYDWVNVTKVAADEVTPYDDMYAIWVGQYTVKFSSDLSEKKFDVGTKAVVNLPALVEQHNQEILAKKAADSQTYLYGGYYQYPENADNVVAYTAAEGQEAYWTSFTPYTQDFSAITKEVGKVYYVKEVPDYYLNPYMQYFYKTNYGNFLTQMYVLTAIDDTRYKEIGFAKLTSNTENYNDIDYTYGYNNGSSVTSITALPKKATGVYSSLEFKATKNTEIVEAANVTRKDSAIGYVGKLEISSIAHDNNGEVFYNVPKSFSNTIFNYIPYYVTLDGVTVIGKKLRRVDTGTGYVSTLTVIGEDLNGHTIDDLSMPE